MDSVPRLFPPHQAEADGVGMVELQTTFGNVYPRHLKGGHLNHEDSTPHQITVNKSEMNSALGITTGAKPERKYSKLTSIERLCHRYNDLAMPNRVMLVVVGVLSLSVVLWGLHLLAPVGAAMTLSAMAVSIFALLFSLWLLAWILRFDEGPGQMQDIADPIREGSEGFFVVQYGTIQRISVVFAALLFLVYFFRNSSTLPAEFRLLGSTWTAVITSSTFLLGAFCSALSGYSGMWVSVRTNGRVASAARQCYNNALKLCFRGGAFSSVINVGLAVGGLSTIIVVLQLLFPHLAIRQVPILLSGYGFGASLVAMFAQLGGGIFTKAADVGADLVGKVEAGIPEDDPRNPAVIADLVGDNVGDCAGQCADLFESIAAEMISAMILGGSLAQGDSSIPDGGWGYVMFPIGVHCLDLVVSSLGILTVRTKSGLPDADSCTGGELDPMKIMSRAYLGTCLVGAVGFCILCRTLLHVESAPYAWICFACCGLMGMLVSLGFVMVTQFFTDYSYPKVRQIAQASVTGPATNVISGLAIGMESTSIPVLMISVAVLAAYHLGIGSGLADGKPIAGLFGTAVATMGMLCTAVFVLSMSSFGPIADNAGGIVEMSLQPEHVRAITDRLDAVGNVTKANTKGFSVGSASLACFLLFSAFLDEVAVYSQREISVINLSKPEVFVGGLVGSMLVFLFSGWAMAAVGNAAQEVVKEVRRQFHENPRIMTFEQKPDYHACVAISSRAALREMVRPGLVAVLAPIAVGVTFRIIGCYRDEPLLGAEALAGFLMFSTSTGILMALMLNNAGGAWDNAKKYVETGALGGKNSETHKASVVGDTVGDPCKDTAGPSVHVLMKLVATVTMVLIPLFVPPTTNVVG